MFRTALIFVTSLAAAVPAFSLETAPPEDRTKFHLFVLAGQSNMAGRGKVGLTDQTAIPGVLSLSKSGEWVPAVDPLHFDKPKAVGVGLGRTFAQDYLRQNPGVVVGLIPCAVGGSPISTWRPGGFHAQTKSHPWDDTVKRVRAAMEVGVLKGVLWHQGESDCKAELVDGYESSLHEVVRRFRSEFGAPELPFVAGQMGRFADRPWDEFFKKVDAAHRALPQKVDRTAFASSAGLTHKGDRIHFDSASYRQLGHRYFAAFQSIGQPDQPNILFILADDVGREVLGCYGGESYPTPNIDQLAAGGQRYEHCYSMPVCHPTRICLLTGRYPAVLGNPKWGSFPREEEPRTMASMLKAAGYATAVAGKWQLGLMKKDLQQPARMGFDRWSLFGWHEGPRYHDPLIYEDGKLRTDTKGKYGPDLYVDFLIDFMTQNRSRPFFAFYSMALCHDVTDDIKEPVPYGPDGRWLSYAEMAADMDRQVGRLMDALVAAGLDRNTVVVFTGDNGTAGASYLRYQDGKFERPKVVSRFEGRDISGGKGKLTDWGTRVPLIVHYPVHTQPNAIRDDLVDFSDFLPTFAELAGATLPADVKLNGHSFAAAIRGSGQSPRKWAYAERRGGSRFLRTRQYKLYSDGRFFDLVADPDEKSPLAVQDLSDSAAEQKRVLRAALDALPEPK